MLQLHDLETRCRAAVLHYWDTLAAQRTRQTAGEADRGGRAAVTGGKQMDGVAALVREVLIDTGIPANAIVTDRALTLPGYFRPTKRWDMLVLLDGQLVAALEFKSQRGPSFGNNFNNRCEEAIGTAQDLWTAWRDGAFGAGPRPWLGVWMLLEDCEATRTPVGVDQPHFAVFPEFVGTSYAQRYELLLRRLVHERLFDGACLLLAPSDVLAQGISRDGAPDLSARRFLAGLAGHVAGVLAERRSS